MQTYISGKIVDVPFGVNDTTDKGTPIGDQQTLNFSVQTLFSIAYPMQKNALISTVPLFSKSNKNGGDIVKDVISAQLWEKTYVGYMVRDNDYGSNNFSVQKYFFCSPSNAEKFV